MHEASLVKMLFEQVVEVAAQHGATAVEAIRVCGGPLSGVEPTLVLAAFERLRPGTIAAEAELQWIDVPLRVRCRRCDARTDLPDFTFRCGACGAAEVLVEQGDGLVLDSVTLRTAAEVSS